MQARKTDGSPINSVSTLSPETICEASTSFTATRNAMISQVYCTLRCMLLCRYANRTLFFTGESMMLHATFDARLRNFNFSREASTSRDCSWAR